MALRMLFWSQTTANYSKKLNYWDAWVAQLLSLCIRLRAQSQDPGLQHCMGSLLGWKPASPLPTPTACVPSLAVCLAVK